MKTEKRNPMDSCALQSKIFPAAFKKEEKEE